jgi:hypothetical protein
MMMNMILGLLGPTPPGHPFLLRGAIDISDLSIVKTTATLVVGL